MVQRNKGLNFTVRYKGGGNFTNALNPLIRENKFIDDPLPAGLVGAPEVLFQIADGEVVETTGSFISYFYVDFNEFTGSTEFFVDAVLNTTTGSLSASWELIDSSGTVVAQDTTTSQEPVRFQASLGSSQEPGIWSVKVATEDPSIARAIHGGTTILVT